MTTETVTEVTETEADAIIASAENGYWLPEHLRTPVMRPVVAGGAPDVPPSGWFVNPNLNRVTPLTITADGHCFGHIATWQSSHIGMAGKVKPPRSRSNYAFFATGAVLTDSGEQFDVGQITLVGGHAPLNASVPKAVAHYDNTKSAVCDVAIGEDRHGIWVAGAVRPGVADNDIRVLRASAVSGDWRPINGNLELVAVCSVNVPGFPIPRARVASGQVLAMVAAGVEPIVEARIEELSQATVVAAIDAISSRVGLLEARVIGTSEIATRREKNPALDPMAASAATETPDLDKLRSRVHTDR